MPRELFPFRYRHALTGRWIDARYKATREEIAARYAEWEITGPPNAPAPIGRGFQPYKLVAHAELRRAEERAPEFDPHLRQPPSVDAIEAFLLTTFLRRYVAYCARRGRYAQMEGAARLHRQVRNACLDSDSATARAPSRNQP